MLIYCPVVDYDRANRVAEESNLECDDMDTVEMEGIDGGISDDVIQFDTKNYGDNEAVIIICDLRALRNLKNTPQGRHILYTFGSIVGSNTKALEFLQSRMFLPSATFTSTEGGKFVSILHCPAVSGKVSSRSRVIECVYTSSSTSKPQVDVLRPSAKSAVTAAAKTKKTGNNNIDEGTRRTVFVVVDEAPPAKVAELIRYCSSSPDVTYNIMYACSNKNGHLPKKGLSLVKHMEGSKVNRITL